MTSLLFVIQGAPGGIGRAERLLQAAWERSRWPLRVRVVRKSDLGGSLGSQAGARGSRVLLLLGLVRAWIAMRPRVVVVGHINFLVPIALLSLLGRNSLVLIVYGLEAWRRPGPLSRLALRRVDAIWSISEFTANVFHTNAGVTSSRIRTIPLAVAPNLDGSSVGIADPLGARILTVTRLAPAERYKGVEDVLRALPAVRERVPSVIYRIVGDGPDRGRLEALTRELGVDDIVEFAGAIDETSLAREYDRCAVFALPSAKEGFGLVYVEAMAAGRPIVAARAGATPEVVSDAETGLLVELGNVAMLGDALIRLLTDDELRARMGRAGRERVAKRYTLARLTERMDELLEEVLS